ncbi:MAG TPA: metallophosphoesterase [Planctomycetota bacterium]|nr:metallophosphoesterase [Planctomycetota bacterium]HRR80070.1 metallophosphoesterase [Planctomycetota bacterium]HRT93041.1 metallophosphoesterase [Planctomycetota bacterium]
MDATRREFLACAASMVVLSGPLASAGEPLLTFAAVSDTHLGKGGDGPAKVLAEVVQEINDSPAEFTLFLGDLVDTGAKNEEQYPKWLETAKGLRKPFYAIPGNHDPVEFFRKHVRAETDYAFDHQGFRFVLFNDTEADSHDGAVTPEQLKWLTQQVDDAAGKKLRVVLCAHIAAHPNKHPDVGWWVRKGEKELDALLTARGGDPIVAFLSGHFHCGLRGWSDRSGVHEIVFPALAWNGDRKLETAPGFSLKESRKGYALVEVHAKELKVRYKPVGAPPQGDLVLGLH